MEKIISSFEELKLLQEEYTGILIWLEEYESIKEQWVEELAKINKDGSVDSPDKWMHLDYLLEASSKFKIGKLSQKEKVADKIKTLATDVFELFERIKERFDTGKITLDQFVGYLRKYQEVIESGGQHIFYLRLASKNVRDAIREWIPGKAA